MLLSRLSSSMWFNCTECIFASTSTKAAYEHVKDTEHVVIEEEL